MEPFNVELRPHHGHKTTPRGKIPVDLRQSFVLLNGVQVGLIGNHAGAPLTTIVRLDPATAERVKDEVIRLRGSVTTGKLHQPPEEPETELVDEDIDEFE